MLYESKRANERKVYSECFRMYKNNRAFKYQNLSIVLRSLEENNKEAIFQEAKRLRVKRLSVKQALNFIDRTIKFYYRQI